MRSCCSIYYQVHERAAAPPPALPRIPKDSVGYKLLVSSTRSLLPCIAAHHAPVSVAPRLEWDLWSWEKRDWVIAASSAEHVPAYPQYLTQVHHPYQSCSETRQARNWEEKIRKKCVCPLTHAHWRAWSEQLCELRIDRSLSMCP